MKIQQISKYVMLAVIAVSCVVFAMFFGFWGDEMIGEYAAPTFTGLLLFLMYGMVALTAGLTIWAVVKGVASTKGNDSAATTGVPGSKITVCTCILFVLSLVIGYVLGIGESDFTAADGTVTPGSMVTVVDMFIWSIYILAIVAFASIAVSMSGILTKTASK
ncbi:MAG: hypothetical protein K2J00_04270 [Bacteroidaceae bacterium]|nr:hypothetical protein [Bacteroidaceae bacterium]